MNVAAPFRRLALAGWSLLGVTIGYWLLSQPAIRATGVWALLLVPYFILLIALWRSARNAFAYAMLAAIVFAVIGAMELVALATGQLPAALFTGGAIVAFFLQIPASRVQAQLNNRAAKTQ